MSELRPTWVKCVDPTDMSEFGIRFRSVHYRPTFVTDDDGTIWKSACWICLYDDGRIVVWFEDHLTGQELRVVYGLAERTFEGGQRMCRYERWERRRKSSKVRQGYYRSHFYVRATHGDATRQIAAALASPPAEYKIGEQWRAIERQTVREDAA